MAWPNTADFPANWTFPVGTDGTDYDGTWVLDTDVPVGATYSASLLASPAANGWAFIRTGEFTIPATATETASFDISLAVKGMPQGFMDDHEVGTQRVVLALMDENGVLWDAGTFWTTPAPDANGWFQTTWVWTAPTTVNGVPQPAYPPAPAGRKFHILFGAYAPDTPFLIAGCRASYRPNNAAAYTYGYFTDSVPSPTLPAPSNPPIVAGERIWPVIDAATEAPRGWVVYDIDLQPAGASVRDPYSGAPGVSGVGDAYNLSRPLWVGNTPVLSGYQFHDVEVPPNSAVTLAYQNHMHASAYEFVDGDWVDAGELSYKTPDQGWTNVAFDAGDFPTALVIYSRTGGYVPHVIELVLGPRYADLIDDFQITPLLVDDGDAESEVGYTVGGIFRWEAKQIVTTEAVATEELQGLTYPWTGPDAGGYFPWLPSVPVPPTPGVAWDFLDNVAFGSEDYGVGVSGSITIVSSATLSDAADAGTELDNPDEPVLESSAIIFDQHEPLTMGQSLAVLADGDELASLSVVASLTLNQDVLAEDVQTLRFVREMEDAASADEVVTGNSTQVQVSAGVADQDVIPGAAVDLLLVEDAQAVELVEPGAAAVVEDVAAGFEDATPAAVLPLLVSEAQALSELEDQADAPPAVLEGMAGATDELLAQVTSAAALESAAVAEDLALYAQPGAVALVMNTETAAVSWYENWQFTDMAQVGNTVLAIGPEGLAVLGGNTDAGDRISASLAWGYRDFGSEQKKRVDSFWFGYSATGLLQVGVQTFGQGYGRFVYRMENRQATKGRNNRITPGQGLNARYWKVDISNVAGCAFDVESMGADLLISTRRM